MYPLGKIDSTFTIPDSVTSIGTRAFEGCGGLESVIITDSVTSIEKKAFYNCFSLASVTIGNNVETIGEMAFCECISLAKIIIPASVESIEPAAFISCDRLISVTFKRAGLIISNDRNVEYFPGYNLSVVYSADGIGTYTRTDNTWARQP